jgi:DNA-binding beta-propeller fold protein YncE
MTPSRLAALALVACAGLGGCGGSTPAPARPITQPGTPAAAEPPAAPPATTRPAGRVVPVGAKPEGVAVDPTSGRVAVAVESPPRLRILDGRSGRVLRSLSLPGTARHVMLAKPGGPFLVPVESANVVEQVSVDGGNPVVTPTGRGSHPHDATYLDGSVYAVDEFSSKLDRIRGGRLVGRVPVDAQPGGVAAVHGFLAVTAVRAYTVELYRPGGALQAQGGQSAGLGPSHVVSDPAGRLYVADTRGQQLVVYTTTGGILRFASRVPLGGAPLGMAVDGRRNRIWVTLAQRNTVVSLPLADKPAVQRRIPTVRQPDSNAVDPATGRLYVASRTDGTLQLVDP